MDSIDGISAGFNLKGTSNPELLKVKIHLCNFKNANYNKLIKGENIVDYFLGYYSRRVRRRFCGHSLNWNNKRKLDP